jgi:hypothetical protein
VTAAAPPPHLRRGSAPPQCPLSWCRAQGPTRGLSRAGTWGHTTRSSRWVVSEMLVWGCGKPACLMSEQAGGRSTELPAAAAAAGGRLNCQGAPSLPGPLQAFRPTPYLLVYAGSLTPTCIPCRTCSPPPAEPPGHLPPPTTRCCRRPRPRCRPPHRSQALPSGHCGGAGGAVAGGGVCRGGVGGAGQQGRAFPGNGGAGWGAAGVADQLQQVRVTAEGGWKHGRAAVWV